jgi:PAS domain S-box-containing protein
VGDALLLAAHRFSGSAGQEPKGGAHRERIATDESMYPVFLFGRAYAISIRPAAAYLAAHPPWAGPAAGLTVMLLTVAVAAMVGFFSTKQEDLERKVRKRTRELRRQNAELDAVLENAPVVMLLIDERVRVVRANHAAARLTDREPEDLIGLLSGQAIQCVNACKGAGCGRNAECRTCGIRNAVVGVFRNHAGLRNEIAEIFLFIRGKQVKRGIQFSVSPVLVENTRWVLLSIDDITDRKQMENALRESEEKARAISETARDAIITIDSDGAISYWNPAAEAVFGYSAEDVMARELHRIIAPERYYSRYRAAFEQFKQTGEGSAIGRTIELTACRRSGEEFPVELSLSAFQLNGRWHATGLIRDITERKRLEKEMHARLERTVRQQRVIAQIAISPEVAKGDLLGLSMDVTEAAAQAQLTELVDAGYDGTLVSGDQGGAVFYELRLGPFPSSDQATRVADAVRKGYGLSPTVIQLQSAPGSVAP